MLRGAKNVKLQIAQTHEALFAENYDLLLTWAFQFTERDRELAEDLLHDTFIHFTLTRPDISTIENLEGFLYVVMRNLHLSQLRKATRTPLRTMSVVEFDTVDVGFWASDPRDRLRMRDELAAVCQYACIRKETSKGGSVLILRFFHGYYPEEIAGVLKSTRAVVHERLRLARSEARTYLEDPNKFGDTQQKAVQLKTTEPGSDLRLELRKQIFESRQGEHASAEDLNHTYKNESSNGPECRPLAHIVSCESCIENVNSLLDLPPLASRYPLDTIGKDPGPKKGGGTGGGAGGAGVLDTFTSRRDVHYYHEPQELCISVNGQLQGFQKVVSGKGELTLILDTAESVGFIEVFSEQGLRLLMLNVEPPPVGDGKQAVHVELSSGRTVDADLSFSGPFPALQVTYNDPELVSAATAELTESPNAGSTSPAVAGEIFTAETQRREGWKILDGFRYLLQPSHLTAGFAALLIAALLIVKFAPTGKVSAAELLTKSADAEDARLANPDRVLHRTIDLEELGPNREVVSRKRIDVWQSSVRGITARRLYDEQGRLAAGDWRSGNGIQTIYRRGESTKLQPLPEKRSLGFEDAWQLSLTAKEFIALLDQNAPVLEERANEYVVSYAAETPSGNLTAETLRRGVEKADSNSGIVRATLTLSKEDLHAIEQTFTLHDGDETHEFRMVEAVYDWRPASAVAPEVFEPNVELTGDRAETRPLGRVPGSDVETAEANSNTNTATTAPAAAIATAALEVEVIEALNNAGAFTGEQVDVSRSGDGKIVVTALVETAARKQALINALANVKNNPAVRIRIETVAEAEARIKRQAKGASPSAQPGAVERVEVTEGMSPVYAELRKKLSDDEARRFTDHVLNRSRAARSHALAMRQLSGRFSAADLQTLTPAERGRWLALIRGHAESFISEAEALRRDLQQFFPEAAAGSPGGGVVGSDTELQARAREIYDAAVTLDRGLGHSFALTAGANADAPVSSSAFWRQFASAVGTARSIAAAK